MTIVAGFCVRDGVLICADTEHASAVSQHESKIIQSPRMKIGRAVFAYAGDAAQLAQAAIQRCIERLYVTDQADVKTPADAAGIVESVINEQYRKHIAPEPDPTAESVYQILVALWCPGSKVAMYETWQGSITGRERYSFLGLASISTPAN